MGGSTWSLTNKIARAWRNELYLIFDAKLVIQLWYGWVCSQCAGLTSIYKLLIVLNHIDIYKLLTLGMIFFNLVKHHYFWTKWVPFMLCSDKFNRLDWRLNICWRKSFSFNCFNDLCTASCSYCCLSLMLYVFRFDFMDIRWGGIISSIDFLSLNF